MIGVVIFGGESDRENADTSPLEPAEMVEVTFTSDPSRAVLFIDGDSKGTTPITVSVPKDEPTRYRLNVVGVGDYDLYEPYEGILTATEDTGINVWITRTTAEQQAKQRAAAEAEREAVEAEREAVEAEREARAQGRTREELLKAEIFVGGECRDIVRQRLRAPRTAKFAGLFSGGSSYRIDADAGVAHYRSYVDAENGFGAMIRNNFTCIYELDSDTVRLISLR